MLKHLKRLIGQKSTIRLLWHKAKACVAAFRYWFPARKLTVIGITGTDGKTTTTGMVTHILLKTGHTVGAASTAYFQVNDGKEENETHLTSISPFMLQKFLRRLVDEGCRYAVVEMSSHGLVQGRVDYTWPLVAGITNISMEHLDYHGSMEQYMRDKGLMFRMLRRGGTKVLNKHDETFAMYINIETTHTITYNTDDSDLYVTDVQATPKRSSAKLHDADTEVDITLNLPGAFNLENALCAIGCCKALGVPTVDAAKALETFTPLPGRMEQIDVGQNFSVFVDFSVSPQSYEKGLESLRKMVGADKRVLVLCSSCGNRMEEKRPIIGQVCSRLADVVVVTEDETYGEDPRKVLDEVWAGVDQTTCDAHKIFDRREAITFLFNQANEGDAVILCGMGPFSTFTKLEGRIPWDERKIAREILNEMEN